MAGSERAAAGTEHGEPPGRLRLRVSRGGAGKAGVVKIDGVEVAREGVDFVSCVYVTLMALHQFAEAVIKNEILPFLVGATAAANALRAAGSAGSGVSGAVISGGSGSAQYTAVWYVRLASANASMRLSPISYMA